MVEGVRELHNLNIVHRDLKMDNIFIDKDENAFIGDLGLACFKDDLKKKNFKVVGTRGYFSYEMVQICRGNGDIREYDEKVDIWNLGIILYEMIFGDLPF